MEFPKRETQFYRISRGEALFCMEFPGNKGRNLEILGIFQKSVLNFPALFVNSFMVEEVPHIIYCIHCKPLEVSYDEFYRFY